MSTRANNADLAKQKAEVKEWQQAFRKQYDQLVQKKKTAFYKNFARDGEAQIESILQRALTDEGNLADNLDEIVELASFDLIDSHLQSIVAPIAAQVAKVKPLRKASLANTIRLMQEAGMSAEEVNRLVSKIRYIKVGTPHPTEHLSLDHGVPLAREQIDTLYRGDDKGFKKSIERMFDVQMAATEKSNVIDEMDLDNQEAMIHREGRDIFEENYEDLMRDLYRDDSLVLTDSEDFHMDTGRRTWGIFDADGKPNAEHWALMAKIVTTTKAAYEDIALLMEKGGQSKSDLAKDLREYAKKITKIYDRARDVTTQLAHPSKGQTRDDILIDNQSTYEALVNDLKNFYYDRNQGFSIYKGALQTLHAMALSEVDKEKQKHLARAYRRLRRDGFALERGQTRHGDPVNYQIVSNLFQHQPFIDYITATGVFSDAEIKQIQGFDYLNEAVQDDFQKRLIKHASSDLEFQARMGELILEANPLEVRPDGYPSQTYSYLLRWQLRKLFPYKFGAAVISDAGKFAPARQDFVTRMLGMDDIRHMPLNEDRSTLPIQPELKRVFVQAGGIDNLAARQAARQELELHIDHEDGFLMMRPCSDAERGAGSGTRMEAMDMFKEAVRLSYEIGMPVEVQLGGGLSMNRFGGDTSIPRRIMAQEAKRIAQERGEALSFENPNDAAVLHSVMRMAHTEQGRAKRIYSASPTQIAKKLEEITADALQDVLELTGVVKWDTFIENNPALSHVSKELYNDMIDTHHAFRFCVDQDGEVITNKWGRKTTNPTLVGLMNFGARPASKSGTKELTDVRAIEDDIRHYVARDHKAGFGTGLALSRLHRQFLSGQRSQKDMNEIMDHPEWQYNIWTKNILDASRSNYARNFERLRHDKSPDWTFDKVLNVARSVFFTQNADGQHLMNFDSLGGTISAEEAYQAYRWYDRLLMLALHEAALNKPGQDAMNWHDDLDSIIHSLRPADNTIDFGPGPKTLARYPALKIIKQEHDRHLPLMDILDRVEEYIQGRIDNGEDKTDIIHELGEYKLRILASSFRAGTLPHWPIWTGEVNLGLEKKKEFKPSLRSDLKALLSDDYKYRKAAGGVDSLLPDHNSTEIEMPQGRFF